jgi:hypothetical protein
MNLTQWKTQFELALCIKLQTTHEHVKNEELLRFDIGIFPWFGSIELSFLFAKDQCHFDDIASWPHYNFGNFNEGFWPEALSLCKDMEQAYKSDRDAAELFFCAAADVIRLPSVEKAIALYDRERSFEITIFNSDENNSKNYYV